MLPLLGITDISGTRQFGSATLRHLRRHFGSSVPTFRESGDDTSGVSLPTFREFLKKENKPFGNLHK